jgi:hypothetical protein
MVPTMVPTNTTSQNNVKKQFNLGYVNTFEELNIAFFSSNFWVIVLMINYFVPNKLIFSNGHDNILALLKALFVALPLA